MLMVTAGPRRNANYMAALFYPDAKILEVWENDEKIAVIWKRDNEFLTEYQRQRLLSGLFPSYEAFEGGFALLVEEMGLNIPCQQG